MEPEAKQSKKEDEADNVTDKENDKYDTEIYVYHKKANLEDDHETIKRRANMWLYNIATNEAHHRFSYQFKDLVMKYQRPVKRKHARRPLENKAVVKIILDELDMLGLIRKESIGDLDKFVIDLYNFDKTKAEMMINRYEMIKRCAGMSKAWKLQKQTEIEQFEDSVACAHDRSKLRDFGIDNLDSEIDETNKCEKPSTSFAEEEELSSNLQLPFFVPQASDKFPTLKKALVLLNDDKIEIIENIVRIIFGQVLVDLEKGK